jgi:hypothetical protein
MSAGVLALLLGLFVVPAFLLWAGHHWHNRSARLRGAFWGGLTGHTLAALIASITAMYKPELWSSSDTLRGLLGFWLMLLAGLAGILIGALVGARDNQK